jgi:phosphatidylglycerophosphate synthase
VILGGYITNAVITGRPMEMKPSAWGKATTFLQILTVVVVLIRQADVIAIEPILLPVIFALTAAACFVSGAGYVIDGIRWYNAVTEQDANRPS